MFKEFYRGKTILVTGHTGFKGSWLTIWLESIGANVIGYSLDPNTENDNFVLSGIGEKIVDIRGDIRDKESLNKVFETYKPEIVFHLAAQPLVRLSYEIPLETYEVNLVGSLNILEAVRKTSSVKVCVMITTDKCYENKEQIWGYRECDPMGGYDPYSSSKGAAEIAIASWRRSFFNPNNIDSHGKSIISVRAGNVIGGGDWSLDRIVPDCIRSIELNKKIEIRSPHSIRPWQHVLEPLSGYLKVAKMAYERPGKYSDSWNFGPNMDSIINVWEIASLIIKNYGKGELKDVSEPNQLHEAGLLILDIAKANYKLGWKPKMDIETTIKMTVDWYKQYKNRNVYEICLEQINNYELM